MQGWNEKNCGGKKGVCLIPQIFFRDTLLKIVSWFTVLRMGNV